MIRATLFLLRPFRPLFQSVGVEFDQLLTIVGTKLLLDTRRGGDSTSFNRLATGGSSVMAYIMYTLLGGLVSILISVVPSAVVAYATYHAFLMFFIALILISDYSSVMLDTSDNSIILPRPVSSQTLLAARVTHIVIYIGQYAFCLTIIPVVVSFITHGWQAGVANVFVSLLSVLLAFAVTGALYLLLIRFFKEERLKTLINAFQIFTPIVLLTGYQLLPRLFDVADAKNILNVLPWWSLAVPPLWMAGSVNVFVDQAFTVLAAACMVLAIATPFALIWLNTRYLAPFFASRLEGLGTSSAPAAPRVALGRESLFDRILKKFTQPGAERATFQLVGRYFSRDRKLKLRMYPSIGYMVVMAVILIFRSKSSSQTWSDFFTQLPQTHDYIIALYMVVFVVFGAAFEIFYSDEYKAVWVFYIAPLAAPGRILTGTLKAIFIKLFLPFYGFISLLVLFIWRISALPAILIVLLTSLLAVLLVLLANEKNLPFSMQPSLRHQGSFIARGIMALILIAGFGSAHVVLVNHGHWQWFTLPVLLVANVFLAGRYANTRWAHIRP